MPLDFATEVLYTHKPVDSSKLQEFMTAMDTRSKAEGKYYFKPLPLSITFSRLFSELALEASDPELVKYFFANVCPLLRKKEGNGALVSVITKIVRVFDWSVIGQALIDLLSLTTNDEKGYSTMEMVLLILDGLDSGTAQDALFNATDEVTAELNRLDPSRLGPPIMEKSLEHFTGIDANDAKIGLLKLLASKRTEWLRNEIDRLDKTFSWEMPDAQFSDNAKVEEFLRGPDETMRMKKGVYKFKGFQDANNHAAKWTREMQISAAFEIEASSTNADAVVTITKMRKWFVECQQKLERYKEELSKLLKFAGEEPSRSDKRARQ
ncbi:unnamed protein product [Phytophthora fragariaefolia]|uniref:Unnamed protein product n=1 Tax=Phytophthora fragariaefolia TaxID=1490495 RepID=A0A9W6XXQ2_9STRA|nr:unnamed protein product [Phytophthora fragariaefolia]